MSFFRAAISQSKHVQIGFEGYLIYGPRPIFLNFCVRWWMLPWSKIRLSVISFNFLSASPTKWPNTLKQFVGKLPTNRLSVFDHFLGLLLKGLRKSAVACFWNKYNNSMLQSLELFYLWEILFCYNSFTPRSSIFSEKFGLLVLWPETEHHHFIFFLIYSMRSLLHPIGSLSDSNLKEV